jgi:hypothetical protein
MLALNGRPLGQTETFVIPVRVCLRWEVVLGMTFRKTRFATPGLLVCKGRGPELTARREECSAKVPGRLRELEAPYVLINLTTDFPFGSCRQLWVQGYWSLGRQQATPLCSRYLR